MNNLSNSFTDDELRGMITGDNPQSNAYRELLALREAQRKVAAYRYRYNGRHLASVGCAEMVTAWKYCDEVELINPDERYEHQPLYSAPQLPAVPEGWSESAIANAITVMLDRIETIDPADDDRIEEVKRLVRHIASPAVPEGWVLVPREPTDEMLASAKEWTGLTATASAVYDHMIAAAPKPE